MTITTLLKKQFTELEYNYLKKLETNEVITNIRLLKKLAKLDVIKLDEQTGVRVYNCFAQRYVTAYYIDSADCFEIENIGILGTLFYDGCFSPYLVKRSKF